MNVAEPQDTIGVLIALLISLIVLQE